MEDTAIIDLYWQRSDQAISETDRKYGRYCHRIAMNICTDNEDAEECVNDTWFRAWNLMPTERPAILSGFLGTITRHLALDRYRAKHSLKRGGGEVPLALDELSDCVMSQSDPEREVEVKELEEAIDRFVNELPETDQIIFISRYWFLVPVAEIAKKSGCTQSKVKTTLFRLRKKLRDRLHEEGLC